MINNLLSSQSFFGRKQLNPLLLFLLLFFGAGTQAQDFHYSQFYNNPLHLSPGLTGIFAGDARFTANYKSQWVDVPVDYKTVTLAYDQKFLRGVNLNARGFFSGGIAFNYDRSGDSRLDWANLDVNASYSRVINDQVVLTLGGKAALIQRSFSSDNLRFDAQYDDGRGIFDPTLPTGEQFSSDSNIFPDFSLGINLRLQTRQTSRLVDRNNRRTKLDLGVALHHLGTPNQAFYDGASIPLERRLSPYAIGTLQVLPLVDVIGAITYQNQGPFYDELVGTLAGRAWLSNRLGRQISIMAGIGLRRDANQDAYWPTFEIQYNNLNVGLNYDFNTSRFDVATENRGGLELSLRYVIKKVRPISQFKICPLI